MILGVSGSPRSQSTEHVLKAALGQLEELGYQTSFWSVMGKKLDFCTHCDYCRKGDGCMFKDDMTQLYYLLEEADAYVFASPVYHGGITGQLKTVLDRSRALFPKNRDVFRYKPVISIAVGGDRIGGQEAAIQQISTFFTINGGIPIGGGSFGANLGAAFWSKDSLEGVISDEEGWRSLQKTIKRLDRYLKEKHP